MAEDVRSEQASLSPAAGGVRQTPRRGYRRAARRPMSQGTGVFSGCLGFAIAALLGVSLFVLVAGVAIGRIGSWFDMNPFGMFAEPETSINDRRAAVVTEMRSLSRLETQQFTIEQVIEAEKDGNMFQDILFGDRILLIANGNVIAGIDFGKLEEGDVRVTGDSTVEVTLPASEVFLSALDNEQTRVYDREQGLLSRGSAQLETEARQAAEASLLRAACDQQILDKAASEAQSQVEALLRLLEFDDVTVDAPAGTCEGTAEE